MAIIGNIPYFQTNPCRNFKLQTNRMVDCWLDKTWSIGVWKTKHVWHFSMFATWGWRYMKIRGSRPCFFLSRWRPINPSYFDVHKRGTRFWPILICLKVYGRLPCFNGVYIYIYYIHMRWSFAWYTHFRWWLELKLKPSITSEIIITPRIIMRIQLPLANIAKTCPSSGL